MAIPAPQALMLLQPLAETELPVAFLEDIRAVEFDPCLSVIAGYPVDLSEKPDGKAVTFVDDSDLSWIGLDSSKRLEAGSLVFVLHSQTKFACCHLEAQDLHSFGYQLLAKVAKYLMPWLATPE